MRKRRPAPEELALMEKYSISYPDACVLSFDTDEELFRQDEKIDWFMIVLSGNADVQINASNGGKLAFGYSISEGVLGDLELLRDSPLSLTTVIAISPTECIAVPFGWMRQEIRRNIRLSNVIGKTVADAFADLQKSYTLNLLASGEQRLCSYILRKQRRGVFCSTLSEAASVIGVSYRHIFRMMGHLCDEGLLEKETDGYHIKDTGALERLAAL